MDIQKNDYFLAADTLNKCLSFDDMNQLALEATNHQHNQSYMAALLYLPEQTFYNSATLTTNVILCRFSCLFKKQ